MKRMTSEDKALLSEAFRIYNWQFGKCLAPSMQCQNAPIQAHSIQNARVIDLLEEKGHVMALAPRFSPSGPDIRFRQIGRNEASTFPGFCNQHDTQIFEPLDKRPFDPTDQEQLFLLTYRGVSRELHATMDAVSKIQSLHVFRVEQGIDPADQLTPIGMKAVEQMLFSWTTWKYRDRHYDEALRTRDFCGITHEVLTLKNQRPALAVSSLISLDDMRPGDPDFPGVAVNVLPVTDDTTILIFSYARPITGKVRSSSLDRILTASGDHQKYELSKLIIARTDNFIVAPTHFRAWSADKVERLEHSAVESVVAGRDPEEHQDLMLF
jgi:hypothetical protein